MNTCRLSVFLSLFLMIFAAYGQNSRTDSLFQEIASGKTEALRMHASVLLAAELMPRNMDSAFSLLQNASKLAQSTNPHHKADYLNTLGVYYWYLDDLDLAIKQFVQITYLQETPDMYMRLARAYNNAGALMSRLRRSDSAHLLLTEALRIDQQRNNQSGIAKTYYDLSTLNYRQGRYELALKYQLESIKTNEDRNDSMRLIYGYNVLGNIYDKLEDLENAEMSYLKALSLSRAMPQHRQESIILNNMSAMFCSMPEEFDVAIEYAHQGLEAIERDNKPELHGYLLTNIGGAYHAVENFSSALHYYHLAREMLEKQVLPTDLNRLCVSFASLYISLGNVDSAYFYAQKALELTGPEGSPDIKSLILLNISRADSIRGDYFSALTNYQLAIALRDSVWNVGNKNRIAELRIIYETDLKAAENQLLSEQNDLKATVIKNQRYLIYAISLTVALIIVFLLREFAAKRKIMAHKKEIDKQNESLIELNNTKDKFFRVIAHDLRGPISALVSLLELTYSEFENMDDAQKIKIIHTLKQSSSNTYNLLENLLEWSQTQTGKVENKPQRINLMSVVNDVFGFLESRANLKNQQLINEVPDNTFIFVDGQLVSNILINLVNNAIKFSMPGAAVKVAVRDSGNFKMVSVIDQGIGIPEDKIDTLFRIDSNLKRFGTENEPGTGLGLIMVAEYLQIIGGEINVQSEAGKGTTFTFSLPAEAS
jgi:signal transduction histidine kinase/Tfp pilus assembly protein PilF